VGHFDSSGFLVIRILVLADALQQKTPLDAASFSRRKPSELINAERLGGPEYSRLDANHAYKALKYGGVFNVEPARPE
jgi:hypothetical protein